MGENALAFVIEAGKELTSRGLKAENVLDTQRVVFFDIFGKYMVRDLSFLGYCAHINSMLTS